MVGVSRNNLTVERPTCTHSQVIRVYCLWHNRRFACSNLCCILWAEDMHIIGCIDIYIYIHTICFIFFFENIFYTFTHMHWLLVLTGSDRGLRAGASWAGLSERKKNFKALSSLGGKRQMAMGQKKSPRDSRDPAFLNKFPLGTPCWSTATSKQHVLWWSYLTNVLFKARAVRPSTMFLPGLQEWTLLLLNNQSRNTRD